MNQTVIEPGNRLTEVLSRIQALSRQERQDAVTHDIPRLTEAYAGGAALHFVKADGSVPILQEAVADGAQTLPPGVETAASAAESGLSEAQRDQLLREMEPVIREAIREAILKELVVVEKALRTTLEQDLMQALRQRLESGRF
jgi:hypothetical protein